MMTFEMRLAMERVANLKRAIAMRTDIPEDKQVLLISGGESLNNMLPVCSYSSAGTDTSPIFLFAKINIESNMPPVLNLSYDDDSDIMEMIESCLSMQPSLDTLVARTELAADLNEQAARKKESCERLVHEQHLQQQGWAAVTANLEDLTRAFRSKSEMLVSAFNQFLKTRTKHEELLHHFREDINRLDSVPILPILLEDNKFINTAASASCSIDREQNSAFTKQQEKDYTMTHSLKRDRDKNPCVEKSSKNQDQDDEQTANLTTPSDDADSTATTNDEETKQSEDEFLDANQDLILKNGACSTDEVAKRSTMQTIEDQPSSSISLRRWIDYHDNQNSLESLVDICWRGLERLSESNAETIKLEVQELLKSANDVSMKVIKGLEERLFTLDKLMDDTKKVVEDQCQLAASFQNNRERFSKVKDSSLLPDLSESHKQQLQIMLSNHQKMIDVRNRCIRAKQELCLSLHSRLRWIMYIEQQVSNLDAKLMIYRENLCRLQRHLEIVEQVHLAPDLYLDSVVEALRRRRFTKRYLHWANNIAKMSQKLYESEMAARKAFDEKLGTHFLLSLFPGLTRSYPPPFATKEPDPFDTNLPRITAADIQYLQANLSDELAKNLCAVNLEEDEGNSQSLNPTPPSSPTITKN